MRDWSVVCLFAAGGCGPQMVVVVVLVRSRDLFIKHFLEMYDVLVGRSGGTHHHHQESKKESEERNGSTADVHVHQTNLN